MKKSYTLSEDWAVVALGFATIIAFLVGLRLPLPGFSWRTTEEITDKIFSIQNISAVGVQFLFVLLFSAVGAIISGKSIRHALAVFPTVYLLAIIAMIVAGNKEVKALNLEAVILSLAIGLIVSNAFRLPQWFRDALSSEMYVKIGLILLGTSVIFGDMLKAGSLGLVQALAVVISVWYFAFWLCKKLKVDEELSMMIASAVSICGVSAAIATAGAIKGDTKKLSYVISLVLITAIPMMILMPIAARWMGLSPEVTGAWLGGTIDTTGAVVAAGSLVGETALRISTIVKFSQNVLLGIAAFAISIYWTYSHKTTQEENAVKPTAKILWDRFPKFVIGFIVASILFSFFITPDKTATVKDGLKNLQGLWFALAFTSIGLETKFSDLFNSGSRKPTIAFLVAQGFNIVVTLIIASMLF